MPPSNIRKALRRGRAVSAALEAATEDVNAGLLAVQAAIEGLRLGVSASVTLEDYSDKDEYGPGPALWLTFGKNSGRWCLYTEHGIDGEPDTFTTAELLRESRRIRLLAVDKLPSLVNALVRQAEREVADVQEKAATLHELASIIKEQPDVEGEAQQ